MACPTVFGRESDTGDPARTVSRALLQSKALVLFPPGKPSQGLGRQAELKVRVLGSALAAEFFWFCFVFF